jgi:hypothetical protein
MSKRVSTRGAVVRGASLVVAALTAASCAPPGAPAGAQGTADGGASEFVAFAPDFGGYRSWSSLDVFDDSGAGEPAHVSAQLVEYINQPRPPAGTPFAVGTIIVKEAVVGDPDTRQAFAMAKRGGDYNPGLPAWEWFEVQNIDNAGDVDIIWRGIAPPAGQTYSGNVNGDCDTCHERAPHDGVYAQ